MADPLRRLLDDGLAHLPLPLQPPQVEALLSYVALLVRWNRAYNLTAVRSPEDMVVRHLLDSLAVGPHLQGDRFVDVGTGAGLPGVPLAITYPERQWTLLDGNGKKTRFLFQVKTQLRLSNIDIVESRVEAWQPDQGFDGALCRAFAELAEVCRLVRHCLSAAGRVYAMKSQSVATELAVPVAGFELVDNIPLTVPLLDEARWLTVMQSSSEGRAP